MRVEDMARKLRKSRATARRLFKDLVSKGLAIRAESFIGRGGYVYEYRAVPPEKVGETMKSIIDESMRRWWSISKSLRGLCCAKRLNNNPIVILELRHLFLRARFV